MYPWIQFFGAKTEVSRGIYVNTMTVAAFPDSKVHGVSMGPTWGRQDPGGPNVGPMNLAIWVGSVSSVAVLLLMADKRALACYERR